MERIWFFRDVGEMDKEEHDEFVAAWTPGQMVQTMATQNRILGRNVDCKFTLLNWAMTFTMVSLVMLFALSILLAG